MEAQDIEVLTVINEANEDSHLSDSDHLFEENIRLTFEVWMYRALLILLVGALIFLAFRKSNQHMPVLAIDNHGYTYILAPGTKQLDPHDAFVMNSVHRSLTAWAEYYYTQDPATVKRDASRAQQFMTDRAVADDLARYRDVGGYVNAVTSGKLPPVTVTVQPPIVTEADLAHTPYSGRLRIIKHVGGADPHDETWEVVVTFVIHQEMADKPAARMYNDLGLFVDKHQESQETE